MGESWKQVAERLGAIFAERAATHDREGTFVSDNYAEMKADRVFSMLVPTELGGGGASLTEGCEVLYELGRCCASTALSLSMHQHVVAANVFKHVHGKPGAKLLEKVARDQLVLLSTGATDWIQSNGRAKRVSGGYLVSGRKVFGSGGPAADVLVTSFAADEEPEGPSVIHCAVPMKAEGVRRLDDWHTLGMRGTGSHTVVIEDVFVPEENVALKRAQGKWHPAWDITLGVALPLIMSVYAGLARAAAEQALERAKARSGNPVQAIAVGRLENARARTEIVYRDMVRLGADFAFTPSIENTSAQLVRKTLLTAAATSTVKAALEVAGGAGFYRDLPFERMWRDVQAAPYHPLPEDRQMIFTGRVALGIDGAWGA